jgi:hypothetical protein
MSFDFDFSEFDEHKEHAYEMYKRFKNEDWLKDEICIFNTNFNHKRLCREKKRNEKRYIEFLENNILY